MNRTHGITHYDPETCFGCKVQTVGFAPSIFTTTPGGAKAADNNRRERELVADLAGFKDMRLDGLYPKQTKGAARIRNMAESTFEVESGQLAVDKAKGRDAAKSISRRGKEWRRRAEEAHTAIRRGETVTA